MPVLHTYVHNRGGGTDFSLGGRVSETMTWRDGPKLGGLFFFFNIDAIRSILGQFLALSIPHSREQLQQTEIS